MPTISGIGQVGQTLTLSALTASWTLMMVTTRVLMVLTDLRSPTSGSVAATTLVKPPLPPTTYAVTGADIGHRISVVATFTDDLGDQEIIPSAETLAIGASPGEISRIEPAIRGVTVSGGDTVILSVDIYGLQDSKDNKLSGTFDWTVKDGARIDGTGREITYVAPNSPGTYTIVASARSSRLSRRGRRKCL